MRIADAELMVELDEPKAEAAADVVLNGATVEPVGAERGKGGSSGVVADEGSVLSAWRIGSAADGEVEGVQNSVEVGEAFTGMFAKWSPETGAVDWVERRSASEAEETEVDDPASEVPMAGSGGRSKIEGSEGRSSSVLKSLLSNPATVS